MKIIDKNKGNNKSKKILAVILIPAISLITLYLGIGTYIFLDMSSYNQDLARYYWWDSDDCLYTGERSFKDFYKDNVDWNFLEQRALIYENWTDTYHICNESWDCATTLTETNFKYGIFSPFYNDSWNYNQDINDLLTNNTSKFREIKEVEPIDGYGDSPMWTGNYMASLAFHYAIACNEGDINQINDLLDKLKRPVLGLHILTHVSGLDGNLARFAIKDTKENRERFESFFYYDSDGDGDYDEEREFGREHNKYPGHGIYEGWWYQMRTSRDQHIGYFFGNSITYKILSETEHPKGINEVLLDEILDMIEDDATDVLDCLIGSNWHIINGEAKDQEGEGRGVDEASLHPRAPWTSGGDIMLAFLSFGKMVDEKKYGKYYDKIVNRFLATSFHFSIDQSGSYYGNNLAFESMFQAYFLEEDPDIRQMIRLHFNRDFYEYIQYHRNSFFNLGWLYINDYDLEDEILGNERLIYKLDDITDNLDRFARWRFPSRDWYIPEVGDADDLVHPTAKLYNEIFAEDSNHILKLLYGWLFGEFSDTSQKSMIALGTDELGSTDFIWQRNPFSIGGSHSDDDTFIGHIQRPGVDYTLVYWMGRYFGYFKQGG
ncbi:MAG: hypothetical protein ACTSR8_00790 [Promethearchaeota archaeon]